MALSSSSTPKDQGAVQSKYPESPSPESFHEPTFPNDEYFKCLPTDKKETLEGINQEKIAEACEKEAEAKATAENDKRAAESAYKIAEEDLASAKKLLDLRDKNKKEKIQREYKQCLRESLPKDHSSDKPIEEDPQVPLRKKAVCIAQLKQKLAVAELEYINEHLSSLEEWAVAENNWRLAKNKYEAANSRAEKEKQLSISIADVEWRQGISAALAEIQGK